MAAAVPAKDERDIVVVAWWARIASG